MEENYYKTKASVKEYIKAAEGFDGKLLISKLKKYIPSGASILEIGSGPGTDLNILKKDYEVIGSDNSTEFINHLISNNPKGKFLELDAVTLATDESFDGIYSNKVLHHLTDEELQASIKRQYDLLNPGGIICHSFWKGEGSEIFKGLFVNYHNEQILRGLIGGKFEVLVLENYAEFDNDDSILLLGRKK